MISDHVLTGNDGPAEQGTCSKQLEVSRHHAGNRHPFRLRTAGEVDVAICPRPERREILERLALLLPVAIIGVRDKPLVRSTGGNRAPHHVELLGGMIRHGPQKHCTDHAEYRTIGANAERQRCQGGQGESRPAHEVANRESKVLFERGGDIHEAISLRALGSSRSAPNWSAFLRTPSSNASSRFSTMVPGLRLVHAVPSSIDEKKNTC